MNAHANDQYVDAFHSAHDPSEQNHWPACLGACNKLLEDAGGHLSRYLRIKTLVLAAGATDVYLEAEDFRAEAEELWIHGRRIFPKHPDQGGEAETEVMIAGLVPKPHYADAETEGALQELRGLLDELAEIQQEEKKVIDAGDVSERDDGDRNGSVKAASNAGLNGDEA